MGYFDSIYATDLPHRAVTVYMYLRERANKEGYCWPAVSTMSRELSLSRSTIQRALRELERTGWITKEPRWRENGSSSSNRYLILTP